MKYFFSFLLVLITKTLFAQQDTAFWNYLTKDGEKILVFTKLKSAPQFPGGEIKLKSYIDSNLNRNKIINSYKKTKNIQYINGNARCIVMYDGEIKEITVYDIRTANTGNITKEFNDEANRIFSNSPKWIPAHMDGKPQNCWLSIPITIVIPANED